MSITFTIPGQPVAKGRPRITTINGFARSYTPAKTANYEGLVALAAQQAGCPLFDGPVRVTVTAYWSCLSSRKCKRTPRPAEWKTTRPDADNLGKAICDGLNEVAWKDDAVVCDLIVRKLFAAQGEPARCEVTIEAIA